MCQWPGDLHLRHGELLAGLVLGHAAVKAEEQDLLLASREPTPMRGDGVHLLAVEADWAGRRQQLLEQFGGFLALGGADEGLD